MLQRIKVFWGVVFVLILIVDVMLISENYILAKENKPIYTQVGDQKSVTIPLDIQKPIQSISISDVTPNGIDWLPND